MKTISLPAMKNLSAQLIIEHIKTLRNDIISNNDEKAKLLLFSNENIIVDMYIAINTLILLIIFSELEIPIDDDIVILETDEEKYFQEYQNKIILNISRGNSQYLGKVEKLLAQLNS